MPQYDVKPQYQRKDKKPSKKTDEDLSVKTEADEVKLWLKRIDESRSEASDFVFECKDAWREFQGESTDFKYRKRLDFTVGSYNRYWSDTCVMLPALYSNKPVVVSSKRFDQDPIANTAAVINDRFANYLMDLCDFDQQMSSCALEFLNSSLATARVYFKADFIRRKKRIMLQEIQAEIDPANPQAPQTYLVDEKGNLPPDGATILQDEEGFPYYEYEGVGESSEEEESETEEVANPLIYIQALHFDEVLHSVGARRMQDIWWMGYKVTCTKKQALKEFGDVVKGIETDDTQSDEDKKRTKDLFTYWEIWDKTTKSIYWVCELVKGKFLRKEKDIYEFAKFFPSPTPVVVNEHYNSVYPSPDWSLTKDLYENLHLLAQRINVITKTIKGSPIFDGSQDAIATMFEQVGDGKAVGVSNFKDLFNRGGLEALIMFPPYEKLAGVLQNIVQAFNQQKVDLDEIRGISDIIRGASDPATSATAERIKKAAANNRFALRQKQFAQFVCETIQMMVDLGYKTFEDKQIKEVVGYNYLDEEDKANFDAALVILRDDKARLVRIDIETDSLVALNEQDNKQDAMDLLNAMGPLSQALSNIRETPEAAPALTKIIQIALDKFRLGKQASSEVSSLFNTLAEKMANPPEMQPPPPDPKLLEIESRERIAMAELQAKQQLDVATFQGKQQLDTATYQQSQAEFSHKQQMDVAQINFENAKLSLDSELKRLEISMRDRELQIEQERVYIEKMRIETDANIKIQELGTQAQIENAKLAQNQLEQNLNERMAAMDRYTEQQKMDLKAYEVKLVEYEKLLEERRLSMKQLGDSESSGRNNLPPIMINVDAKQPGPRQVRFARDPMGNIIASEE